MKTHRIRPLPRVPPLFLLAALVVLEPEVPLEGASPATPGDFATLAMTSGRGILLAREATAVAAEDLSGDAAEEWIAALPSGGILIHSPDRAAFEVLLPEQRACALTALGTDGNGRAELIVALSGGGVLALHPASGEAVLLSDLYAVSLASGDVNDDGRLELVAALSSTCAVVLDGRSGEMTALSTAGVSHVASGDFLGRGYDQIALSLLSGDLEIQDLLTGDVVAYGSLPLRSLTEADIDSDGVDEIIGLDEKGALLLIAGPLATGQVRIDWLDPDSLAARFTDPFLVLEVPAAGEVFLRGDTNGDGAIDISDCIALLNCLFLGKICPDCPDAADSNDSGALDISDVVFCLFFLFDRGDDLPGLPDLICSTDPTPDALPECRYPMESCP